MGFPHSSVGKESTWDAGDPGPIPGSGRSAGDGIGYPLQYSWASLVAQLVNNPPAVWETWVRSLGERKGYPLQHSSLENFTDYVYSPWGHKELVATFAFIFIFPWTARRSNQSVLTESSLNIRWKDWWWSWSSSILVIWCGYTTHWKSPWCW